MAVCLCIALFAGDGSVRGQRSEVRSQSLPAVSLAGSEIGGQRSEVRSQKSEVRGQKSEVRGQACSLNRPIDFEKKGSPGTASTEEIFEYFNGFIVHIKRGDFHHRILVCDVVIELNRGMKLPQERIELRKIIYNTLKELLKIHLNLPARAPVASQWQAGPPLVKGDFQPSPLYQRGAVPSSPLFQRGARGDFHPSDLYEIRRSLKEEIKISLNNFMNDEIMKNIYFTKFVLL